MRALIAGSSGFLGTALTSHLRERGYDVVRLVRRTPSAGDERQWDPVAGVVPVDEIAASDVVVNLGGSPLIGNPHSERYRRELRESRVQTTSTLARGVATAVSQGASPAFLAGNGIAFYGDRSDQGDPLLTEQSDSRGDALLTSVTRDWEAAAQPAVDAGARVCILRTTPVLHRTSMPLKALKPLFQLGLGGPLGNGRQHFPTISLADWLGAVTHLAEHEDSAGPYNLTIPEPATNADLTRELADAVHRPAFLRVPAAPLRLMAGPLAPEVLGSVRAVPEKLLAEGYTFQHPTVRDVVRAGLAG